MFTQLLVNFNKILKAVFKYRFYKKSFRLTIFAITALLIFLLISNLQINTPNNSQLQTELKVDIIKAIAQSSPTPSINSNTSSIPLTDQNFPSKPFFEGSDFIVAILLISFLIYPIVIILYLLGSRDSTKKELNKGEKNPPSNSPNLEEVDSLSGSPTLQVLNSSIPDNLKYDIITSNQRYIEAMLPKLVEAITVILIILIVSLLSLTNKIKGEAAISVLSALIGYVLGKQVSKSEEKVNPTKQELPPVPDPKKN